MKYFLLVLLTLFSVNVLAQDKHNTILSLNSFSEFDGYNLSVNNLGTVPISNISLETVEHEDLLFDYITNTSILLPEIGSNNDGKKSKQITFSFTGSEKIFEIDLDVSELKNALKNLKYIINYEDDYSIQGNLILSDGSFVNVPSDVSEPLIDGKGTANLSWSIPNKNEDGSDLNYNDIGGYLLYWQINDSASSCLPTGPTSKDELCYDNVIDIPKSDNSHLMEFFFDESTRVYWSMVTYTNSGLYSALSDRVSKNYTIEVTDKPDPKPLPPIFQSIINTGECAPVTGGQECKVIILD